MGGAIALPENDYRVHQQTSIMEDRVLQSEVRGMDRPSLPGVPGSDCVFCLRMMMMMMMVVVGPA
jgi:hypothetical protein